MTRLIFECDFFSFSASGGRVPFPSHTPLGGIDSSALALALAPPLEFDDRPPPLFDSSGSLPKQRSPLCFIQRPRYALGYILH